MGSGSVCRCGEICDIFMCVPYVITCFFLICKVMLIRIKVNEYWRKTDFVVDVTQGRQLKRKLFLYFFLL